MAAFRTCHGLRTGICRDDAEVVDVVLYIGFVSQRQQLKTASIANAGMVRTSSRLRASELEFGVLTCFIYKVPENSF